MALSLSMVGLLLAMSAPARPARAAKATFDDVLAGKVAAGRNVDVPAVLLPPTAVQTVAAGKTRHFVLAVKKDSAYMRGLRDVAEQLRGRGLESSKELATVVNDDSKYRALMKEVDALIQAAIGGKVIRTAVVSPAEAIVVEVAGMEGVKNAYAWETILDKSSPAGRLNELLGNKPAPFVPPPSSFMDTMYVEAATRTSLLNLALGKPPDLDILLPVLPSSPKLTSERELESFNAAVEVYNAELKRRRQYAVQRTEEDIRLLLARLDRILAFEEAKVSLTVTAKVPIAADTYQKVLGASPTVFARERGKPPATFAARYFATTDLIVCSYPTGATVTIDGTEAGTTPYVARAVAVGSRPAISVSFPGHAAKELKDAVAAHSSGVRRLDVSLDAEGGAATRLLSTDEGKRLFSESFAPAKPFVLHVSSPTEQPGYKGKKDKDGVKRVAEIRKLVAGPQASWFRAAATPDEADVVVTLEPRPKDSEGTHVLKTLIRAGSEELASESTVFLNSEKLAPVRLLVHLSERLKNCCWPRALGVE